MELPGHQRVTDYVPVGHEYCGVVEDVGPEVASIAPGQFVIGSFLASDGTCPHCRAGFPSACVHRELVSGAQAEALRVPLADGTLVPTRDHPDPGLLPSLLTLSDVMSTGWFAAECANVQPGMTVAVVRDGAVGLLGILSAARRGAARLISMSRHAARQRLAREFGATDIVAEPGEEGVARIKELTAGVGADATPECVGTGESMGQAVQATRPGGFVGVVGVPHGVAIAGSDLFSSQPGRHPGRPGASPALPAGAHQPRARRRDRPGQGLRPGPAPGPGGRGLPGDGRAASHQGLTVAVRPAAAGC